MKTSKEALQSAPSCAVLTVPTASGDWAFEKAEQGWLLRLPGHVSPVELGPLRWEYLEHREDLVSPSECICVAQPPALYFVGLPADVGSFSVLDVTAGDYLETWYEVRTMRERSRRRFVDGGETQWVRPTEFSGPLLLVWVRQGR